MAYGTSMEPSAVATLTNTVMPLVPLFENLIYCEEGKFGKDQFHLATNIHITNTVLNI